MSSSRLGLWDAVKSGELEPAKALARLRKMAGGEDTHTFKKIVRFMKDGDKVVKHGPSSKVTGTIAEDAERKALRENAKSMTPPVMTDAVDNTVAKKPYKPSFAGMKAKGGKGEIPLPS